MMSESLADRRKKTRLPEDMELSLFDSQLIASSRVVVSLDRQMPQRSLKVDSDIDDNNCACE
jgi:hypothetical protein